MGISKGERFNFEDIYVDYPFENVMFRWDFSERIIYRKFYGEKEHSGSIPHHNRLYNDALLFGDEITREEYMKGKTP